MCKIRSITIRGSRVIESIFGNGLRASFICLSFGYELCAQRKERTLAVTDMRDQTPAYRSSCPVPDNRSNDNQLSFLQTPNLLNMVL